MNPKLAERNSQIVAEHLDGAPIQDLSERYKLTSGYVEKICKQHAEELRRPQEGEIALSDPTRMFRASPVPMFNPSVLVTRKGLDVFDLMRRDDQIKAACWFKKMAVLALREVVAVCYFKSSACLNNSDKVMPNVVEISTKFLM